MELPEVKRESHAIILFYKKFTMARIKGIDSIRFLSALAVMLGHFGVPAPDFSTLFNAFSGKIINGFIGCIFNGPAAVIVFFVISGFCIHFPFRNNESANLPSYYSRRIIRICFPAFVALIIYNYLDLKIKSPEYGVFWSVICELIYYILYPAVLFLKRKSNWINLILLSYFISLFFALTNLEALQRAYASYVALGGFTWIIGLPCWLLGCWLAENYSKFPTMSIRNMWLARLGIFSISIVLRIIKFHVHSVFASNVFTLNAFAIIVCVWLGLEIVYFQERKPNVILEKSGRWSYSLYMIHPIVPTLIAMLSIEGVNSFWLKISWILFSLFISYIFFLLVENPSHKLAIFVSKQLTRDSLLRIVK